MKISTKGRYAMRLMLDLALNNTGADSCFLSVAVFSVASSFASSAGAGALGYTFYINHFLTQNYFAGKIKQNIWKCLILRDKKK